MGIFDMLCVLEQKGCLVLLLGMLFVRFCIGIVFRELSLGVVI